MNKKCKSEKNEIIWKSPFQELKNESGFGIWMVSHKEEEIFEPCGLDVIPFTWRVKQKNHEFKLCLGHRLSLQPA